MKYQKKIVGILGLGAGVLVGCTVAQLTTAQTDGQLFCAKATSTAPLVVALSTVVAGSASTPVSVIGQSADTVAKLCQLWDASAIPVSPPSTSVPTETVATK